MQTIHLNSNNFRLFPRVYMVQNDTGRDLKMVLDDITLAGTETGAVAINRSDGSYYTISAARVSGENAFTADMTQALTQPGLTKCQLKVTASTLVVSTYTFTIHVEESTDGLPSEEQLGYSVQDLMNAAQTIVNTADLKAALLQIASKVAYIDEDGQTYYDALYDALYPPASLVSISAVFTQGSNVIYDLDSLDTLRQYLVVTATYDDQSTATITEYTLSGTLTTGTSTITVSYDGKTTTFTVTVTHATQVYDITNSLTNCSNSNSASRIGEGESYAATITANQNYLLLDVVVTMGGNDITSTAYNNGTISIASVTGAITIYATASAMTIIPVTWAQGGLSNTGGHTSYDGNRYKNYRTNEYIPIHKNQTLVLYNTNPEWTNKNTYSGTDYIRVGSVAYQVAGTTGNADGSYVYLANTKQTFNTEGSFFAIKYDEADGGNVGKVVAARIDAYNMAAYYETAVVAVVDGV